MSRRPLEAIIAEMREAAYVYDNEVTADSNKVAAMLDQWADELAALETSATNIRQFDCINCLHPLESHCNAAAMQGCYDVAPDGSRCGCEYYKQKST